MSESERALIVAGIAASATIGAALTVAAAAYFASKRERRRALYGEAFKAAMGWTEMLYRVRRRTGDNDADLVALFHALQESLTFHEGWIGSESRYMARSFRRLVKAVKAETQPLITEAWTDGVRTSPGNAMKGDVHPDFGTKGEEFLRDVRAHSSPWQIRKLAVWCRNREKLGGR